jgi:ERCC4-related helicase
VIAGYVAAEYLKKTPGKSVVMLAPTKPLVLQHFRSFQKMINIEADSIVWLTGEVGPEHRLELWRKRLIFSTPQVFLNDLLTGKISLDAISLIIFDEAHRAMGDYPYVFIADRYASVDQGRILGLTASPGSSEADLREICQNLHLESKISSVRNCALFEIRDILKAQQWSESDCATFSPPDKEY